MTPHWPSPLVAWILAGWTGALIVGTAVWWWLCRPTRDVRAAENAAEWVAKYAPMIRRGEHEVLNLPARSGACNLKSCDDKSLHYHVHGKVFRLPARSGVNAMFDPGRETRP